MIEPLPEGPWDIIYADPPWRMNMGSVMSPESGHKSGAEDHYPTMPLKDICAIPVIDCAADDALLFLWTSGPVLRESMTIGEAWGFKYSTIAFNWHKRSQPILGYYTMPSTELCLLFKRGRIPQPKGSRNEQQFLSEPRTAHSAKPLEIRRRIERMFPTQRRLELFARQPADGWTVWGNQANGERIRAQVAERQETLL